MLEEPGAPDKRVASVTAATAAAAAASMTVFPAIGRRRKAVPGDPLENVFIPPPPLQVVPSKPIGYCVSKTYSSAVLNSSTVTSPFATRTPSSVITHSGMSAPG